MKDYLAGEKDIIVFDTDYSPVKGGGVKLQEKSIVISQKETEEELTLTITTSGAVKPREALQEVLELSKDSFNSISNLLNNSKKKEKIVVKPTIVAIKIVMMTTIVTAMRI